nr:Cystathionine beta-lyase MetC [Paraburkholderia busanensis]
MAMNAAKAAVPSPYTPKLERFADATRLMLAGRDPGAYHGFVNPPVYHGSTVLSPTTHDLLNRTQPYIYGRRGTPTSDALEHALCELEGGAGAVLCPSGLSACTLALLTCLSPGDHLLMTANVYGPVRHACDGVLRRMGIDTTYYDPLVGADLAPLIRPRTRAIYVESPGSYTFEVQDVATLANVAHAHGLTVIADNSWATPLFYRPHDHGVDLSIQAGTKYLVGHSDAMLGTVSANAASWPALKQLHGDLGLCVGPDDMYLALRGLRTLGVRLRQHQDNAHAVASWLRQQPQVNGVLYPAFDDCPGHALWKRDFKGASGLFSVILHAAPDTALAAMLDPLELVGLGYSWGGFESLAVPFDLAEHRIASHWPAGSIGVRLHIGLEDPADLIADLAAGLQRFSAACPAREDAATC